MNYLAHLLLSGDDFEIQAGNLFGDEIKGRDFSHLPHKISVGVSLHRYIDYFTDSHEINLEMKKSLYPYFSKYAGVALDIYYDYFLAKRWGDYSEVDLEIYCQSVYENMPDHLHHFSEVSNRMFGYMRKYDWLTNYRYKSGMGRTFEGMSKRLPPNSGMKDAMKVMEKHYLDLNVAFGQYFPDVIHNARIKLLDLLFN